MNEWGFAIGLTVVVLALSGVAGYGASRLSSATTPISVTEVEPGVRCASMVTYGGPAIDCWQVSSP